MANQIINSMKACLITTLMMASSAVQAQSIAGQAVESPWGPDDEIGSLNKMGDMSRADILRQVSGGSVYDLGVDLFVGMPNCCSDAFGDPSFQMWMIHAPARGDDGGLLSHSGDAFSMSSHTGTHIDTLSHFGLHGKIWNRVDADDAVGVHGWARSGAEKYPHILARGVLIDVAKAKNLSLLPASYSITVVDLQDALRQQGTTVLPGDVILVRTGLMTLWPDKSKLRLFDQPGLSLDAARWLVEEKQALLLGADNFGLERFPSENPANFAPVHTFLLAEKGVSFMELLWLEDLSKDQLYEFLFIASPLKIRGATGAPIRPLAIPIQNRK